MVPAELLEEVSAVGERVDEVVQEDVLLMKVDVEGLEPGVMASAQGLLRNYRCAVLYPAVLRCALPCCAVLCYCSTLCCDMVLPTRLC